MKKFLIIIGLCLFQTACSIQSPRQDDNRVLLDFSDLASEMTIRHERDTAAAASASNQKSMPADSS